MANSPSVYSLLVADPNDVLAALAYTTYKQHKVETIEEIEMRTGQPATPADLEAFERTARTPSALAMYGRQAEHLIQAFLRITLSERQGALTAEFANSEISRQLAAIQANQNANRTVWGWFRVVGGNLAVNIMTILVIGALLLGYRWYEEVAGVVSSKAGLHSKSTTQPGGSAAPTDPSN